MEGLIHGGAYFQNFTVIESAFKFEPRFQPETKISFVANFLIDVVVLSAFLSQWKILNTHKANKQDLDLQKNKNWKKRYK